MSVFKRKSPQGETQEYHYKFMQAGKWYYGVCENCTSERTAQAFEKKVKETAKKASGQKSIKALIDNFADELTGGSAVALSAAFELFLKKPKKRYPGSKQLAQKQAYWHDFFLWIQEKHPDVENMRDVRRPHAEEYVSLLRTSGSFQYVKEQHEAAEKAKIAGCPKPIFQPQAFSPATVNVRHKTIKAVFTWLAADAGIAENPFNIQFLDNQYESRDAFTPDELKLIGSRLDHEPFVKPIFLIGICTGMSEGDICNLRWQDIRNGWIVRRRHKTGAQLEIPVLPPLAVFLEEQRHKGGDHDCVLPEHAQMYESNPTGVTYRVKQFLEKLGIQTTRIVSGRARASSVKDVHSLRHTFAYMAGVYNIPLPIVQSVLGHMSPEMTKHYQAHADREAKQKYLAQMDNILGVAEITMVSDTAPERETLKKLADALAIDKVRAILDFAAKL